MESKRRKKTYLIIGLGRFGGSLALRLTEIGAHIVAVDKVRARVEEFSDKLEYVAQLDAIDEAALAKVGAKDVDAAVVCLGEESEATILVTAILIDFCIPRVIARANNRLQAKILAKIGAHEIISPESEMGRRTADLLENPWMKEFAAFGDENHIAGKISARPPLSGKSLLQLALPSQYGATVMVLERNGKKLLPQAELVLEDGDILWLFGEKERITPLLDLVGAMTFESANAEINGGI